MASSKWFLFFMFLLQMHEIVVESITAIHQLILSENFDNGISDAWTLTGGGGTTVSSTEFCVVPDCLSLNAGGALERAISTNSPLGFHSLVLHVGIQTVSTGSCAVAMNYMVFYTGPISNTEEINFPPGTNLTIDSGFIFELTHDGGSAGDYCYFDSLEIFGIPYGVTENPTLNPSENPTRNPSKNPSQNPSNNPTLNPSENPTLNPSKNPSKNPTVNPSENPTKNPSKNPTLNPSKNPTNDPTTEPTINPTINPTLAPSIVPSIAPSIAPTNAPSIAPSLSPSISPTTPPTAAPSSSPTYCCNAKYRYQMFGKYNDNLWSNEKLISKNCKFFLKLLENGNLVLYGEIKKNGPFVNLWMTNATVFNFTGESIPQFIVENGIIKVIEHQYLNVPTIPLITLWNSTSTDKNTNNDIMLTLTDMGCLELKRYYENKIEQIQYKSNYIWKQCVLTTTQSPVYTTLMTAETDDNDNEDSQNINNNNNQLWWLWAVIIILIFLISVGCYWLWKYHCQKVENQAWITPTNMQQITQGEMNVGKDETCEFETNQIDKWKEETEMIQTANIMHWHSGETHIDNVQIVSSDNGINHDIINNSSIGNAEFVFSE